MQRIVLKLVVIVASLVLLSPSSAYAKLALYSPADMITKSQLIVIAKATQRSEQGQRVTGKFAIQKVLIGDYESKTILVEHRRGECDATPDIPDVGTEVFMLLLKDYEGNYCCINPNSMGIIKNGRVACIYQGVNVDRQPYVHVYNCFIEGIARIESESARKQADITGASTSKDDLAKSPNGSKLIYTEVLIPAALLILFLYLRREHSETDQ